jgi:catechol 2,3-dioxygenase-like lactoylglutathione lyase family enzyme
MSGNLLLSHPRFREAAGYYEKVFGLELLEETENEVGLKAGDDLILYVEGGESGFVFEFNVPKGRPVLHARSFRIRVQLVGEGRLRAKSIFSPAP